MTFRPPQLSATSASTADLRKVFEEATNVLKLTGKKTVLFIDEIQVSVRSSLPLSLASDSNTSHSASTKAYKISSSPSSNPASSHSSHRQLRILRFESTQLSSADVEFSFWGSWEKMQYIGYC